MKKGEEAEKIDKEISLWNRAYSIHASVSILIVTIISVFLYLTQPKLQFVAQAPFFSEIVLLMGSLNLISLYWIITALKPRCSIFKLAAKNRKHTSDQVAALTISLFLTLFWIFMAVQSFDLAALILMSVITVTMNFLTLQLWLNDLTEFQQFLIGEQPDTEKS